MNFLTKSSSCRECGKSAGGFIQDLLIFINILLDLVSHYNNSKSMHNIKKEYLLIFFICILFQCKPGQVKESSIRFGICTDIHKDIMYDADVRLNSFIQMVNSENVDFIIEMGDFCFPTEENKEFLEIWNSYSGLSYHVLGNHDMDVSSKTETMEYLGMEGNYYSFDLKGFHIVVLDPNYFIDSVDYVPFDNGNYYEYAGTRGNIPPEQLVWLKEDLAKAKNPTIVFSHQGFSGSSDRRNVGEVRRILENANEQAGYKKVIACFNGHNHSDKHTEINGINYIQVNSMSYQWLGSDYAYPERYSNEINEKFQSLKYTAPYKDPLFAIVEIKDREYLKIEGRQTERVLPSPQDLGYPASRMRDTIPLISDLHLTLD